MSEPRTKQVTLTEGREVNIDVGHGDPTDMKYFGGPRMVGYDFFVDVSETKEGLEAYIVSELKKYSLPCLGFYLREPTFQRGKLWSREDIAAHIKKDHKF